MEREKRRKKLKIMAALVLVIGLASALLIYLTAQEGTGSPLGYVIVDGKAYPVSPEESKIYRHELERYGGKWNVVADELTRWFADLWKGKNLGLTVGGITLLLSGAFFCGAKEVGHDGKDEGDNQQ